MAKLICSHTIPLGEFPTDELLPFVQTGQPDPASEGYRDLADLAEDKVVCVMEVLNNEAVAAWLKKMGMPFNSII